MNLSHYCIGVLNVGIVELMIIKVAGARYVQVKKTLSRAAAYRKSRPIRSSNFNLNWNLKHIIGLGWLITGFEDLD